MKEIVKQFAGKGEIDIEEVCFHLGKSYFGCVDDDGRKILVVKSGNCEYHLADFYNEGFWVAKYGSFKDLILDKWDNYTFYVTQSKKKYRKWLGSK